MRPFAHVANMGVSAPISVGACEGPISVGACEGALAAIKEPTNALPASLTEGDEKGLRNLLMGIMASVEREAEPQGIGLLHGLC